MWRQGNAATRQRGNKTACAIALEQCRRQAGNGQRQFVSWLVHGAAVLVVVVSAGAGANPTADKGPVERFIDSLGEEPRWPAEATELVRTTWDKCQDCDAEEFLTQGLTLLSQPFREGLDAYHADQYEQCAAVMEHLRADPNPFIAVHAAVYEIKALVARDDMLGAGRRLAALLGETDEGIDRVATYSYFAPEMRFLQGFCLLADLQYAEAERALQDFLQAYPDASQRLVIPARQMLAELQSRQPGRIGEVVDLMNYAGRRLALGDAGETVRSRQDRVIELLDNLIDEAQQQEQNSSSSASSGAQGSGSSGGATPSSPMQDSILPQGGPGDGSLREARRVNPGEVWGAMPPAERERILQALRESFPARYRQLVEQYYEQLGKKP